MKTVLFTLLLAVVTLPMIAQESLSEIKSEAFRKYRNQQYEEAIALYQAYTKQYDGHISPQLFIIADCYANLGDIKSAAKWLRKAAKEGFMTDANLGYYKLAAVQEHSSWPKIEAQIAKNKQAVATLFAKLQEIPSHLWIPYQDAKLGWGYVHRDTREVLVPAQFRKVSFIGNSGQIYTINDGSFWVSKDGEMGDIAGSDVELEIDLEMSESYPRPFDEEEESGGFIMSRDNQRIISYNPKYSSNHQPAIQGPFAHDGKYYAIVEKDDYYGIIDSEGNTFPGFDFNYRNLQKLSYGKNLGLLVKFEDPRTGEQGVLQPFGAARIGTAEGRPMHSYTMDNELGRVIFSFSDNQYGVANVHTGEWVVNPQPIAIKRVYVYYSDEMKPAEHTSVPSPVIFFEVQLPGGLKAYMSEEGVILRPQE